MHRDVRFTSARYMLILLLAPFLFFWRVWWPGGDMRWGFQMGDFSEQHVAMRTFVVDELRHGRLPFWDPYTFAGEPAVADSLFSTYYPPSLWQLLFPRDWMYWVLQAEAMWHAGLAGIFTFLAVRRFTGSKRAAMLAGLALAVSGYITSYPMLQIIILQAAIWLPASVWALDIALSKRSWRYVLLTAMFLAWSVLAGHFQTFMYVAYGVAAFFLWRSWQLRVPWHWVVRAGGVLALGGLGLSAAQWMPSLQMLPFSPHANVDYEYISNGFQVRELLGLLWPDPHQWSPLYVGLIPLILAAVALVRGPRKETWFWGGVAGVTLLLSMGRYGFLFPLVYRWWPGLKLFREQERWVVVTVFALVVLAGYGYAWVEKRWPGMQRVFWLLMAVLFLDLYHANGRAILQKVDPRGPFPPSAMVDTIRQGGPPYGRVSSEGLLPGGANAGLVYHVRDVVGSGPLYQAVLDDFVHTVPELRWWQMLNVRYVITRRHLTHGGLHLVLSEGDAHLYQTFIGAHTAWLVHAARVVSSQQEAVEVTARPDLDPFQTAVLERPPAISPRPKAGEEHLEVVDFGHRHVTFQAKLSAPGILVASEMWYPGWRVYVNGRRAETLRAYGMLRAVALPAGEYRVEWRFEPSMMWGGLAISVLTALGMLMAAKRALGYVAE